MWVGGVLGSQQEGAPAPCPLHSKMEELWGSLPAFARGHLCHTDFTGSQGHVGPGRGGHFLLLASPLSAGGVGCALCRPGSGPVSGCEEKPDSMGPFLTQLSAFALGGKAAKRTGDVPRVTVGSQSSKEGPPHSEGGRV